MIRANAIAQHTLEGKLRNGYQLLGWETGDSNEIGFHSQYANGAVLFDGFAHKMTFSKTGGGKGISAAIPELQIHPGPMVAFDTNGELYAVTHEWRRKHFGQEIILFDPYGICDPKHRSRYNPFDIARLDNHPIHQAASMLCSLLMGTTLRSAISRNSSNDEFWQDSAFSALTGYIGCALEGKLPGAPNIPSIRSFLKSDDPIYNTAKILDEKKPSKAIHEELSPFIQTTDVTRSGILSTLLSHFRGISGDGIDDLLSETSFDLKRFVDGTLPATIYLVIPPEQLTAQSKLVRLIIGSLVAALFTRRYIPKVNTLIQIDEAATLGMFEPFRMGVTLLRGNGVMFSTMFQDIDQVFRNYDDAKTLINNTSIIRILGASNYGQANTFAELFGVSPKKLMNLEPDEQLLIIDGRLTQCRRLNYLKDEFFRGRFAPNPRYSNRDPDYEQSSRSPSQFRS